MNSYYQIGGSLPPQAPSYVERQADDEFFTALLAGQFCYVLNARQMGKSSLRVRATERLQAQGVLCVTIDLTAIGTENITQSQWYVGIARCLLRDTQLLSTMKLPAWWREHENLSLIQRFDILIDEIILPNTQQPIVVLIDESDSIRSLSFSVSDLFAFIRSCYDKRADNPIYQRLTFSILGVASPADLITDKKRTPFNIGTAIDLHGFTPQEATPLAQGLNAEKPAAVLQAVLDWTGGQPFLTQKLCRLLAEQTIAAGVEVNAVAAVVQAKIIDFWETQDEPQHLRTIRDRLLSQEVYAGGLLGLYQQVLLQGGVALSGQAEMTTLQTLLRLTGLVVQREGCLQVYNPIYASVFNADWVEQALQTLRPYSEALRAWQASGKTDESRLLHGQALTDALSFAQGQELSAEDYAFLTASQQTAQQAERTQLQLQTQRRITGISVGFSVIAISLAIWAWIAQQQAWENAKLASQQKDLALEVINTFTYEIPDILANIPNTHRLVAGMLEYNITSLDKIYALDPDSRTAQREKAVNLGNIGQKYLNLLGDTKKALEYTQQAVDINETLAANDPQSAQAQRDLSVSYEKLGNVNLSLGNTQVALDAYQKFNEIAKTLAANDPQSAQAQRDLSVSYEKLGNVQLQIGNTEQALTTYEKSLAITKQLADADPESAAVQRTVSVSYNKLGNVNLSLGNTQVALDAYQKSLEIDKTLAANDPQSAQAQRDLSISYNKLGDVNLSLGNTQVALDAYQKSLEIRKTLAANDPQSAQAQRDLSVSYEKLGNVNLSLGNTQVALDAYQKST
jgi:tetratricopeptide (TPR) repeat protein